MRNVLVLACCALVVLAVAAPALAQADNQTENPDPCQGSTGNACHYA
jgi:hypothetical protein